MAINGVSVNNTNEEHINYDAVENRIASAVYNKATNVLTFHDEEGTQKFNVEIEQDTLELDTTLAKTGYAADAKAVGDEIARVESSIPNVDSTLSVNGDAADAGATGSAIVNAMNHVAEGFNDAMDAYLIENAYGQMYVDENNGLHVSPVTPSAETVITDSVDDWLDDHPEATTTVQDGSITEAKLHDGAVTEAKLSATVNDKLDEFGYSSENFTRMIDDKTYREGEGSTAIFACVSSWLRNNDKLYYGNQGNCNSFVLTGEKTVQAVTEPMASTVIDGKYPLDCMSFVDMCLRGIGFEESAYGDKSNLMKYPCMSISWANWDFAKYAYVDSSVAINPIIDYTPPNWNANPSYRRVLTHQYARFLRDHGLYCHVGGTTIYKARQMLRVGDILFYGNPSDNTYVKNFDSIYHCAICCGWNKDGSPLIVDCTDHDSDHPIAVRTGDGAHSASRLMGYARIPLGGCGAMGLEENLNLLVPKGNHAQMYESTVFCWLAAKSALWNIYKFTVAYMYTDASDIANSFPAIYWAANGLTINRLTESTQQAKSANKWYIADIIVPMDIEHAQFTSATITDENDRFHARFYPNPSNTSYIKILKVTPIMLDASQGISLGRYELRDSYSQSAFASWSDVVTYFKNHYIDHINNGDTITFGFKTIYVGGSSQAAFIKVIKLRSDHYIIGAWNNVGFGAILRKQNGTTDPVITTYDSRDFPIEQWM